MQPQWLCGILLCFVNRNNAGVMLSTPFPVQYNLLTYNLLLVLCTVLQVEVVSQPYNDPLGDIIFIRPPDWSFRVATSSFLNFCQAPRLMVCMCSMWQW